MIWCTKYRYKILRGRGSGACARSDSANLPGTGRSDRVRSGVAGSHPFAAGRTTDSGTREAGTVHKRTILTTSAGGVSGTAQALLGTAHVGARLLLRDGGRSGRVNDQGLYRKSKMGRDDEGFKITAPTES